MTGTRSDMDSILLETWSYLLYKAGKDPVGGQDKRSRIKKGIWREDGLDLTLFARSRGMEEMLEFSPLLDSRTESVREGLFRKRRDHVIITGVKDLSETASGFKPDSWERGGSQALVLGSDILHPMGINRSFEDLDRALDMISVERRTQSPLPDIGPARVLKRDVKISTETGAGEDLLKLFKRAAEKKYHLHAGPGREINDLPSLLEFIFTSGDREMDSLLEGSSLFDFLDGGLKSPELRDILIDLSTDPTGGRENASRFRERLGRWILDGPLGDEVSTSIVSKLLTRLSHCPEGEANKLENSLRGLMGPRATEELTTLLFSAPPEKRPHMIRLLGRTRDRAAMETLRRLLEFSTVEADRESARSALRSMGEDV